MKTQFRVQLYRVEMEYLNVFGLSGIQKAAANRSNQYSLNAMERNQSQTSTARGGEILDPFWVPFGFSLGEILCAKPRQRPSRHATHAKGS